jgi:DNA-binding XRE family transcriptional regulator
LQPDARKRGMALERRSTPRRLIRIPARAVEEAKPPTKNIAFGQRVRELRESKHMTQDELASGAGVKRLAVNKIENGKSEPNLRTIRKIARKLEVSLKELFTGVD